MIIAHRGYHKHNQAIKENTLAAFAEAFACGADAVECDLRLVDDCVVVSHDFCRDKDLLTLDQLFDFITSHDKLFFLEVKSSSLVLAQAIIDKIERHNLWPRVQIIGFRQNIKAVLAAQNHYPLLRVSQILTFPVLAFVKMPPKSYGVYFGWLDAIPGSRALFKRLISPARLKKLKDRFEAAGFKVMTGVVNETKDLPFFSDRGVNDIFTDNVIAVVEHFRAKT